MPSGAASPSRGDAAEFHTSVTAGFGSLDSDHLNTYISGYYFHSDPLAASKRPYPFNTYDWSKVCATLFGPNNIQNAIQPDGSFTLATGTAQMNFMVRPYAMNGAGTQLDLTTPLGPWPQETQNCGPGRLNTHGSATGRSVSVIGLLLRLSQPLWRD